VNAVSVVSIPTRTGATELEQRNGRGDLSKSAEIQYGKIPDLRKLASMESNPQPNPHLIVAPGSHR